MNILTLKGLDSHLMLVFQNLKFSWYLVSHRIRTSRTLLSSHSTNSQLEARPFVDSNYGRLIDGMLQLEHCRS